MRPVDTSSALFVAAGLVQLAIASANLVLPGRLRYREELGRVSPLIRQIFVVHSIYIVGVVVLFAGLCLSCAADLAGGSPLGRYLRLALAAFWLPRPFIQLFYYDSRVRRENRVLDVAFLAALFYLAGAFTYAAVICGR